ncbi:protein phosphatase 1 regulatory subunit 12B-like [Pteropus vampyrus]|uniref:Protein phosphatase 1 regulatory subunit n=1 Tax=Pteropus vampyrus TaxID=132908 RepID=A0A6P6CSK5_PTEVA|nr:protein phosphatase 1 regulatory subunit 12B-like [Pteropus vampyrus]
MLRQVQDSGGQACIDENFGMVRFLVESGADVDQQDNEGWTPLHAAASCGHLNIAEYFLTHGASVAVVNSEGEVPSDLAEEPAMKDLLLEQVKKQGVDLEQSRGQEEQQMLQDARQWLNSGRIEDTRQARSGATALHVAAAKGYSEVLRLLIQAGYELDVQDHDGWTPLHAAAHWGVKEACSILAEALCDMDVRNKLGQTPFEVADEGLVEHLETLQKQQSTLRSEKETRNRLIEADLNGRVQSGLFKDKEKLLYEEETSKSHRAEDGDKEPSSCSSEEDEGEDEASESEPEPEPEADHGVTKGSGGRAHCLSPHQCTRDARACGLSFPDASLHVAVGVKHPGTLPSSLGEKPAEPADESPSSWRLGLRKTGSHGVLSEVAPRAPGASLARSSSGPWVSALGDGRDKDRAISGSLSSLTSRRPSGTRDTEEKENRESAASLVRSGSYTRQPWRDGAPGSETPQTAAPSTYVSTYLKRTPHKSQADPTAERTTDSGSPSTPLCVITNRPPPSTANGVTAATLLSAPGTDASVGVKGSRRSYLTPVRDEEAESLRRARSRQARQARRATQGVTLTDLQEAERTFSRSRAERQAQEQPGQKPVGTGGLQGHTGQLQGHTGQHEPPTEPTAEAGESRQPRGQGSDVEEDETEGSEEVKAAWGPKLQPAGPRRAAVVTRHGGLEGLRDLDAGSCKGPVLTAGDVPRGPRAGAAACFAAACARGLRAQEPAAVFPPGPPSQLVCAAAPTTLPGLGPRRGTSLNRSVLRERRGPPAGTRGGSWLRTSPKPRLSPPLLLPGRCGRAARRPELQRPSGVLRGGTMSSLYTRSKEFPRSRRAQPESPPASPSPTAKALRHERLSRLESAASNPATSDPYADRASARARREAREARLASLTSRVEEGSSRDYRKLYESALAENQKLKAQLQEAQRELADVQSRLEKVAQRQEKTSDRSSMLEVEKREKRALERKMSEMEEEMKVLTELKSDNQRLKDENGALIRVISKLSK